MMNCKPGDLAIIIKDAHTAKLAGMLVEVLYVAPNQGFVLPDGVEHLPPTTPEQWVVKFPHPVLAPWGRWGTREANYGCVGDRFLRPLPGKLEDEDVEEMCADNRPAHSASCLTTGEKQ